MPATATRRRRPTARRRSPARSGKAVLSQLARARRSGGPEDHAFYRCCCGQTFTASVSTSVGCPTCGETQTW